MWDYIWRLFGVVTAGGLLWLSIIFLAALFTEIAFPGACLFLEVLLIFAGFKIAQGTQAFSLIPFLATVCTGRLCGSTALYWLSALPGGRAITGLGKHIQTAKIPLRWVRWELVRFTLPTVIIARFTPGFGIASTITCGASRIEYKKFFAAVAIHVLAWEAIFLALGALGTGISQFFTPLSSPLFLVIWIAVTIAFGASLGLLFSRRARARVRL